MLKKFILVVISLIFIQIKLSGCDTWDSCPAPDSACGSMIRHCYPGSCGKCPGGTAGCQMKIPCPSHCATCVYKDTKCATCSDSNAYGDSCQNCNSGTYSSGPQSCTPCNSHCNSCSSSYCYDCDSGYYSNGSSCYSCLHKCNSCNDGSTCSNCKGSYRDPPNCICADGYYDGGNLDCDSCPPTCTKCTTETNCTDCKNEYFLDSGECKSCMPKCATCLDAVSCTSCKGAHRTDTDNPQCLCDEGYYDNLVDADCQPCPTGCGKCSDENTCTKCIHKYYLDGIVCKDCLKKCSTCENDTECTGCTGAHRSSNIPNCECNVGYYDDLINADCPQCAPLCKSCENGYECQSCIDKYYLKDKQCHPCLDKCALCVNDTECTKCHGVGRAPDNIPNCECGIGYYDDLVNADCPTCAPLCKSCENGTECQSCIDKYYLDSKQCHPCLDKCALCVNDHECTKCHGVGRAPDNIPNCECSNGYWDDTVNADCVPCNQFCFTCVDNSKCESCEAGSHRTLPDCLCEPGYFDLNGVCEKCSSQCKECVGTFDNCLSCVNTENRLDKPTCNCKDGYFHNSSSVCERCHYPCNYCYNETNCKTCVTDDRFVPTCECKQGFLDTGSKCESCNPVCLSCKESTTICDSCYPEPTRQMDTPRCECKDGFFLEDEFLSHRIPCKRCPSQCKTCNSIGICTQCLSKSVFLPLCMAPNQGFMEQRGQDQNFVKTPEQKCRIQCGDCQSEPTNCIKCSSGLYRTNITPDCKCKDGYHDENNTMVNCKPCQKNCLICDNSRSCLLCDESNNFTLNQKTNQCHCKLGYKLSANEQTCEKCLYFQKQCIAKCPQGSILLEQEQMCQQEFLPLQRNQQLISFIGVVTILALLILNFKIGTNLNYQNNINQKNLLAKREFMINMNLLNDINLKQKP